MTGGEVGGTLVVERRHVWWADRLRTYRVLVDGQEVGRLRNGGRLSVPLATGPHVVEVRIDWTGSRPVEFDIKAGSLVTVRVSWRGNVFTRDGYLRLDR